MELGTGVFLSAIFLGMVALFIATKDRWNWKKIFLWPLGIVVGLSVIGGLAIYIYQQYEARPQRQTELWGIALKASPEAIKFAKGEPTAVDEDLWWFSLGNDYGYVVLFKNGKVRAVAYDGPGYLAPTVSGVSPYSSLKELEEKLGPASFVSRSKDQLQRWYSFEKFNVIARLEKGEIRAIGIYDPETGPIRFKDEAR